MFLNWLDHIIGMKLLLPILALLLLSAVTFADSTQQYNKLYLNPFYKDSLTNNVNSSFSVTINPPDRIAEVNSAILNFNVYATGQTTNYSLWMNGQQCNTRNFYVSTTYATSGQVQLSFDCTNIMNKAGTYSVVLRPSGSNTGAVTGWLEITYMNKPQGTVEISGTEYARNDLATVFVQLLNEQGIPVNNGACNIYVWYPSSENLTHPYTVIDSPMMEAAGDDGIYYYDWSIPSDALLGVYMLSVKCSYAFAGNFVYGMTGSETNYPIRNVTSGTYTGGEIFLNDYEDWIYTQCASSGGATKSCEAWYTFNTTVNFGNTTNFTVGELFYMGEASAKATMSFYVWNWTSNSWTLLANNLTFSGGATSVPIGIGDFASNNLPMNDSSISPDGIIRIRTLATFGNVFAEFDNWLNIKLLNYDGLVTDVKGSGEMHVTDRNDAIASSVWNYTNRTLTDYNNTEIFNLTLVNPNLTALQVWSFSNRSLTDYNTTELYHLLVGSANMTPAQVWSYGNRTLTDYNMTELKSLLVDTNNTVYMNKASLATALVLLATINSTVFAIDSNTNGLPASISDLIATTHQTNATVNMIWAFLQNQSLNITVNATVQCNASMVARELAFLDVYEYFVTPTGYIDAATGGSAMNIPQEPRTGDSIFGGVAYGAPNGYSSQCLDADTLQTTVLKVRCIDNDCRTIETNTTEECNYGCDATAYPPACMPSTSTSGMWFFIIIIVIIVLMVLLVRWATKRV